MSQSTPAPPVTVAVTIPWLAAVGAEPDARALGEELRLLWIIERVRHHDLSVARGAELLAMPQATFMQTLGEHGVPVIDHSPQDLERELLSLSLA